MPPGPLFLDIYLLQVYIDLWLIYIYEHKSADQKPNCIPNNDLGSLLDEPIDYKQYLLTSKSIVMYSAIIFLVFNS